MSIQSREAGERLAHTTASRDGTPIAFWRSGEGPPLVLVHGTAADHGRWRPVLPAFEASFTVYAIDRRGRGDSGDADGYSVEREFEDVAEVVDSIGGPVNLLGHSYGALCAMEAALLTRNVRKLLLYDPGIEVEQMRSQPVWQARVDAAHTIPRELRAVKAYGFDPARFGNLAAPTLVLNGGDSPTALVEAGEAVDEALSDSRRLVMPGQGHAAMDTGTERFTTEVLRFLATG
jgi:pimeloyl-ACP methyl ester carboxylesterase